MSYSSATAIRGLDVAPGLRGDAGGCVSVAHCCCCSNLVIKSKQFPGGLSLHDKERGLSFPLPSCREQRRGHGGSGEVTKSELASWSLGGFIKTQIARHTPRVSVELGLGGARELAFITNSWVMLLLLTWGPHWENHSLQWRESPKPSFLRKTL